jgi:hypothetical protein
VVADEDEEVEEEPEAQREELEEEVEQYGPEQEECEEDGVGLVDLETLLVAVQI